VSGSGSGNAKPGVLELADQLWRGEIDTSARHPMQQWGELAEVGERTAFVAAFANVSAFTTDAGLVLVDTGSSFLAARVHESLRTWAPDLLHTAVFTHGHIDHCFGVDLYEAECREQNRPAPRVVAHEAITARFDRYRATAGYNAIVNRRQFGLGDFQWPVDYRYPDETYRVRHDLTVGDEVFELHHARGETDDHTWVWAPDRRVLCSGDLFIWASPNCGNPQKVQRYAIEWARALDAMAALGPEVLLPGHGLPIVGADRVRTALTDAARLLEYLHTETIQLMNEGARLDDIVHTVAAPPELLAKPYLRPIYDEPEFVVRNVWRLFGGWYDGNPAHLKPAPERAVARELADLAGGAPRLAQRAVALAAAGDLRLAGHLAELASLAAPDDPMVQGARADVFEQRVEAEASTMAKGIFGWAVTESRARADAATGSEGNDGPRQ
jgi:alkyl sulfatase BDS1-like metallo-beta-lactamase superfamily hydrolase